MKPSELKLIASRPFHWSRQSILILCLLKTAFRLHFAAQTVRLPTWRHEVRGHPGAVRPGALDGDIALEGIEIAVAYIVVSETE